MVGQVERIQFILCEVPSPTLGTSEDFLFRALGFPFLVLSPRELTVQ